MQVGPAHSLPGPGSGEVNTLAPLLEPRVGSAEVAQASQAAQAGGLDASPARRKSVDGVPHAARVREASDPSPPPDSPEKAVARGDFQAFSALLEAAPLRSIDEAWDLLLVAMKARQAGMMGLLATHPNALLSAHFSNEIECLFFAAECGRTELVEILSRGFAPDVARADGTTLLMIAAQHGRLAIVEQLLDSHPEFAPRRRSDGASALYLAAENGHLPVVQAFMRRGMGELADLPTRGITPIVVSRFKRHTDVERALLAARPAAIVTDDTNWCIFTGPRVTHRVASYEQAARGERELALHFMGDGSELTWDQFKDRVQNTRTQGSRWLINAHGGGFPHVLEFAGSQAIETTEVIKLLVERGVRRIDIYSCGADAAARELERRMRGEDWPLMHERLEVVFHSGNAGAMDRRGEEFVIDRAKALGSNLSAVDGAEAVYLLRDFANPGSPARREALALSARAVVSFDPGGGPPRTAGSESPMGFDEIERLLPSLTVQEQALLVGNYLFACCVLQATSLQTDADKVRALVDPNYKPTLESPSIVAVACATGQAGVLSYLMHWPHVRLAEDSAMSPLCLAAENGHWHIVRKLLQTPQTKPQIAQALEAARRTGHQAVVAMLSNALGSS